MLSMENRHKLREILGDMNAKYVAENNIKEWANKSAYMASKRNAFTETKVAKERKARFGRFDA